MGSGFEPQAPHLSHVMCCIHLNRPMVDTPLRWTASGRVAGDNGVVRIRLARDADLSCVQLIDRASAQMFNDVGMAEVGGMLWSPEARLPPAQRPNGCG